MIATILNNAHDSIRGSSLPPGELCVIKWNFSLFSEHIVRPQLLLLKTVRWWHSASSSEAYRPILSWHRSCRDHTVEVNRWAGASWNETGQQVQKPFSAPFQVSKSSSVLHESMGAGVKLNHDFSDSKYKHGPVVLLCSLRIDYKEAGLIAGVTRSPRCLRQLHNYLIMWHFKLSNSTMWTGRHNCDAVVQSLAAVSLTLTWLRACR